MKPLTDRQVHGFVIVVVVVVLGLAGSCYAHDRRDCKAKGGELHGWRERICVKPGSVIE